MLQNLDLKMEIVEVAENNAASENWKATTELFRELMDKWKSIGRTTHDKNEELWSRLIAAKNVFYEKKRAHFEVIQVEQEENYKLKLALVEKAEALKDSTEWQKTAQAFTEITNEWKQIGKVPIDKAKELWDRLNAAKDVFFGNKRQHIGDLKRSLEENYEQKLELVRRAEELKTSTHWREATIEMNELMDAWKQIGPVPREHNNDIWERFITSRKKFFERKDADRERRKQYSEQQHSHRQKQAQSYLQKLYEELNEEEDNLEDFHKSMGNITPGLKEEELRTHLQNLIAKTEENIRDKKEKIAEQEKKLEETADKNEEQGKDA